MHSHELCKVLLPKCSVQMIKCNIYNAWSVKYQMIKNFFIATYMKY